MRAVAFAAMLLCLAAACTESRSSLDVGSRCDLADGGVAACPEFEMKFMSSQFEKMAV